MGRWNLSYPKCEDYNGDSVLCMLLQGQDALDHGPYRCRWAYRPPTGMAGDLLPRSTEFHPQFAKEDRR
ncbi:MAG: hypothetical protein KatS3mg050_1886 [Litorilinea sp.]|nr:MAG: hypothetical protein KatS3mg050_1886 [Litorilinea sp.]